MKENPYQPNPKTDWFCWICKVKMSETYTFSEHEVVHEEAYEAMIEEMTEKAYASLPK